jgi:hypothetical protein
MVHLSITALTHNVHFPVSAQRDGDPGREISGLFMMALVLFSTTFTAGFAAD